MYEKKEFDAKQAYYKKQLDALKKFESDRQNVIQTTDQRKIENSTTMAENKMNKEWKPNDEKQFLNFAQTQLICKLRLHILLLMMKCMTNFYIQLNMQGN